MTKTLDVEAIIDGRPVARADVHRWESRRADAVLKKFASRLGSRALAELLDGGIDRIHAADLETRRSALLTIKTRLGHTGIYAMLRHGRLSTPIPRFDGGRAPLAPRHRIQQLDRSLCLRQRARWLSVSRSCRCSPIRRRVC